MTSAAFVHPLRLMNDNQTPSGPKTSSVEGASLLVKEAFHSQSNLFAFKATRDSGCKNLSTPLMTTVPLKFCAVRVTKSNKKTYFVRSSTRSSKYTEKVRGRENIQKDYANLKQRIKTSCAGIAKVGILKVQNL